MGDLIDRDAALNIFAVDLAEKDRRVSYHGFCIDAAMAIDSLPSAEKHGKWTVQFADNGWIDHICSECGFRHNTDIHIFLDWRYCPSCGAVMEEEKGQWEI